MLRISSLLSLLVLVALAVMGCQPIQPETAKPVMQIPEEAVVVDGVGPSMANDPTQAQAEDEFLAVALAKEQAYYDGDYQSHISYYADDIVSTWPDSPEIIGKSALAEGMQPYIEDNSVAGTLAVKRIWVSGDYATRQAEWDEYLIPKDGGDPQHYVGRCTLNWEKIDGEWKVVSEFVNYLKAPEAIAAAQ